MTIQWTNSTGAYTTITHSCPVTIGLPYTRAEVYKGLFEAIVKEHNAPPAKTAVLLWILERNDL